MPRADSRAQTGWGPGTTVSVSRLPGPDAPMARAIGIGELTARLEVGSPIALRLDAGERGRVLAATAIVRIEAVGPDTLRIETRNHRYELRRVAAIVAGRAMADATHETTARSDATRIVAVEDWPEAAPGRFETGARVTLTQERGGERHELGLAILLTDLVPGEPASFSVEGRVVATSPVREVVESGKRTIRIATGNSVYRLELVADGHTGEEASHG
ncbi:MAG: hypothetical protein U0900_19980 [Myxococcota bacterium]